MTPPRTPNGLRAPRRDPSATRAGIDVAVIDPASQAARHTVLALMGFAGWLDPFEVQRFQLLADRLEARVIVPETPGCSRAPSRLSGRARSELLTGDFRCLADTMLTAAAPHLPPPDGTAPLHLIGYSLGASVAAAVLAAGGTGPVRSITLVEPVAIRRRSPLRLLCDTRTEDARTPTYIARNNSWPGAVAPSADDPHGPRPAIDPITMLLEGNALRHPRLLDDLTEGLGRHPDATTIVAHGLDSRLSPAIDCRRLVSTVNAQGHPAFDVPLPGGHPLWHSLDAVADLATAILDRWHRST